MTVTPTPATNTREAVPTSPDRARRRSAVVLGLLVAAQFVVMLDTSIVNVALPSIQDDLGLHAAGLSWVVNAYVLSFGGLLLPLGRIADVVGRHRMFMAGAALFTLGTLLAAGAGGAGVLIVGRVVQGVGAAALSPAAMSLLLLHFPGPRRARAMSLWGAASTVGGATGVLAGGLLAGSIGWRSVFLVTVPVTIAAAGLARRVLEDRPTGAERRVDLWGAAAVTGAVLALVHGLLSAADGGGISPTTAAWLVGSAVLACVFISIERRAADPLVPVGLFRSRELATGVTLAVLGGAARASTFVLVALYLQSAVAMSPQRAGLAMVPTSLTGFAVSLALLPRVLRRFGPQRSLVAGLVVLAAGHLWLAHGPAENDYLLGVLPALLLVATGVALSFTPTTMVIASATPEAHAGLASGLASSATQVGAALGTAAFTAIALSAATGESGWIDLTGFSGAFTAAALVSLATAAVGAVGGRKARG